MKKKSTEKSDNQALNFRGEISNGKLNKGFGFQFKFLYYCLLNLLNYLYLIF